MSSLPLDDFQKAILAVIRRNRTTASPFAGGAVIQRHGIRLSDDQDIFTEGDPGEIMRRDIQALEAAGFTVRETQSRTGFRECRVMRPDTASTVLHWAAGLSLEYFSPVPDDAFGRRLHMADLAANKVLAATDRVAMRDFVDLWMLDRHVMPLWRMACAATGKSPLGAPLALIEAVSRNLPVAVARDMHEAQVLTTADLPDGEPTQGLRAAIDEAREILPRLPAACLGRLQLDGKGRAVTSREPVPMGEDSWVSPEPGGALPAPAGTDDEMIANLIAEYGPEGSRYTGTPEAAKPSQDGDDGTDSGLQGQVGRR